MFSLSVLQNFNNRRKFPSVSGKTDQQCRSGHLSILLQLDDDFKSFKRRILKKKKKKKHSYIHFNEILSISNSHILHFFFFPVKCCCPEATYSHCYYSIGYLLIRPCVSISCQQAEKKSRQNKYSCPFFKLGLCKSVKVQCSRVRPRKSLLMCKTALQAWSKMYFSESNKSKGKGFW